MLIDVNGLIINTDHVVKIRRLWDKSDKEHSSEIEFFDGRIQTFKVDANDILAQLGTIIPNSGSWVVVMADGPGADGSHGPEHWTIPVLAFRVMGRWGMPEPITVEGELGSVRNEWALLAPDGRCFFGDGETAESVTEWISRLNSRGSA